MRTSYIPVFKRCRILTPFGGSSCATANRSELCEPVPGKLGTSLRDSVSYARYKSHQRAFMYDTCLPLLLYVPSSAHLEGSERGRSI